MNNYLDYAIEQIMALCNIPSPSGFTKEAEAYLLKELTSLGYFPWQTNKGSVLADLGGEGKKIILAAHVDTLGAMVRAVKGNGALRLTKIGGYAESTIEAENCIIHTREGKKYSGVVLLQNASLHVNKNFAETKRDDSTLEVLLDENVKSAEDVKKLGIAAGDFISFDPRTRYTESGFLKSRHLDDKASAGILLALARWVKEEKIDLSYRVYLLFTTYEEVGHGGAAGLPDGLNEFISVDMGAVGDDLTADEYTVSICAKDSNGPYDYDITGRLINLAKEQALKYAVDIYPSYGSDAGAALHAGYDVLHGLIGPGVYASHGYERTHKQGIDNTLKLLQFYISKDSSCK